MSKRVYISGPISNNPRYIEDFKAAEDKLRALGYEPVNPCRNTGDTYKELIDARLKDLMTCDAMYMLPGWQLSAGATLELKYAQTVGMEYLLWLDR